MEELEGVTEHNSPEELRAQPEQAPPQVLPTEGVRNRGATGVWRGRLRSREKCPAGDAGAEGGKM